MGIFTWLRSKLSGADKAGGGELDQHAERLSDAASKLDDVRGDRITPGPADSSPNASDNVAAAAKDFGLTRFSGESDALGGAAGGYRAAKSRKERRGGE